MTALQRHLVSTRIASTALLAIAAVHAVWATGSAWPMKDRKALAAAAGGRPDGEPHRPSECLAMAAILGLAATFVAGRPRRFPRLGRVGAAGVVTALGARGACGLAGRTDLLSPGATSDRFRTLDRRYYSPLCLTIAAAAMPAVTSPR